MAAHLEKLALDAERSGNGLLFLDEEKLMRELETGTISDEELVDGHLTRLPDMSHPQENGTPWNPSRETIRMGQRCPSGEKR